MEETQQTTSADSTSQPATSSASSATSASADNATTSISTPATRPSGLPKPSGLKPPSKIGRLCSNSAPKPAVPISPRTDGSSSDNLRKLSDEYSRKHLSDLVEAEEEGEVSSSLPDRSRPHRKASTSSTYSVTSMDALWEKHPRRLSEAGLRRSSDHSVVLTEDTDSFIIGDRVWVGGSKPGQIAYIGETQFAPGEWAGIVLDDPIGKNDGSVAGVRYFQCSERLGVFSRLTRLTRVPLAHHDASPSSDAGSVFDRPPSGLSRPRRALSPNGSVRSAVSSKMNASVTTTGAGGELRMGDRVIVSSSRGSKAGTLRYVGVTEFAPGVWAGVELDDPLGKNDGAVEGKRYFECAPRFGLFAPISKVSRSPSNRKPGACAIHSNGRATPIRRSNSRESLTSLGTSIASSRAGVRLGVTSLGGAQRMGGPRASSTPVSAKNALQELLREKQQHLERLLKERELERADVAKVTLQAGRAESALAQLRKDTVSTNTENEKLKLELEKLGKLLEDERQKVEDLMFRNEEENINKEDYHKYREAMEKEKSTMEQRIRELEAEAALQTARADAASGTARAVEDQRAAEVTAIHEQHKEELSAAQALSSELQKLLDEAYALLKEKENEKDSQGKSMTEELSKVKAESEKALNEARSKIAVARTEFETQLSVLNAKWQLAESKLETEKQNAERLNKETSQTVIDLNAKLSQLQAALDDKSHELNKVMGATKEHELNLNKEITKLKMELSARVLDYEQLTDTNKKQENACQALENEIAHIKQELTSKVNEYETLLNEVSQQNEQSKVEILELKQNLTAKAKEYEKLLSDSGATNTTSERLINEYKQTIHERDKEIIKLKNDYEQVNANFNIQHSKIAEEYKKEIDDRNAKIDQLLKEIETHKHVLEKSKIELDSLNSQFVVNVDEIKLLKDQNEEMKMSLIELKQINSDLKTKISSMELEIGELKRQFDSSVERCSELEKAKEKIETEYLNLTGQATDSNEQFNRLAQHLKETEKELQELKDKHRDTSNSHGRIEQELKQQIFKIQEEYSLERGQLMKTIDETAENSRLKEHKINEYEIQLNAFKTQLRELEFNRDKITDDNVILRKEVDALKCREIELNDEYQKNRKQLEDDIDKYKQQVTVLKAEGESSEVMLKEKVDQLIEAQNELNNKLEESRKHEDALQKIVDDMTLQLNNLKIHYEKEIAQAQSRLATVTEDVNSFKSEEIQLKQLLQEQDNVVKDFTLKLGMCEVDLKSNAEIISEKERQLEIANTELNKVIDNKKNIEEKLQESTKEYVELKQKYEAIISNSSVEESLLKDQQDQVEKLTKEVATLTQEKCSWESTCAEVRDELNKLKTDHEVTIKALQENVDNNTRLKKTLEEKEVMFKSQCDKNETELNRIKIFEQELSQLKHDITNKNEVIQEKEQQLNQLNELIKSSNNETQLQLKSVQEESTAINLKHKDEIEYLNKTLKSLQNQLSEQSHHLEELNQCKYKITELQNIVEKSENDIKQLTNINEGQKANYEDLHKQLKSQYEEYRKEAKRAKSDLKAQMAEYEKELQENKNKMSAEIAKQVQLQETLEQSERNVLELSNKLEVLTLQQNADSTKDDKLEKITLELQALRKSNAEALANNESLVNKLKTDHETSVKNIKDKDIVIVKLQEDIKNHKAKIEIAEREKALLQKEMLKTQQTVVKDNNDNGLPTKDNTSQHLQEEKDMVDGQVSFLNSVIVDMQKKNEQLMARVQALESGTSSPEPALFNGRKPRAVAPRLFCDICDVFDAHDTEECPRQAAVDDPAPLPPTAPRRPPPPPRDYCDICEVFGHSTENCDEEETF